MTPQPDWVLVGILSLLMVPAAWLARGGLVGMADAMRGVLGALSPRTEGFDQLPEGRVALRGAVVAIDPIVSPETGRRGVYLTYTADRWGASVPMGRLGGQWLRAEASEEAAPFELTDGKSAVLVEPEGASFELPRDQVVRREQQDGTFIRYQEGMLEEGDEVLVVGTARLVGGFEPSELYRGHNYRVVVCAAGGALMIRRARGQAGRGAVDLWWRVARLVPAAGLLVFLVRALGWY